jgi:lysophospholipase L1-like esterase
LKWIPEEAAQGDGLTMVEMRNLLSQAVDIRRDHGDRNIRYLSGLELLSADDRGHLPDGTHPDMAGHAKMGHRFFDGLLKDMT